MLYKIFYIKGDYKIILNDLNPQWLVKYDDRLINIITDNIDKIVDLRIPVQSGSNSVLKRMRRPYKIEQIKKVLNKLTFSCPNLKIYTHFIIGFPGETAEEFNETKAFLKDYKFDEVALFRYQDRDITESHKMKNHLSDDLISTRVKFLSSELSSNNPQCSVLVI